MHSSNIIVNARRLLVIYFRVSIAAVAVRLDIFGNADADRHGTHGNGTDCGHLGFTVTSMLRWPSISAVMHGLDDFRLMQGDTNGNGVEGYALWRAQCINQNGAPRRRKTGKFYLPPVA